MTGTLETVDVVVGLGDSEAVVKKQLVEEIDMDFAGPKIAVGVDLLVEVMLGSDRSLQDPRH